MGDQDNRVPLEALIDEATAAHIRAQDTHVAPAVWFTMTIGWPSGPGPVHRRQALPVVLVVGADRAAARVALHDTLTVSMQNTLFKHIAGAVFLAQFEVLQEGAELLGGEIYLDPELHGDVLQCWCAAREYVMALVDGDMCVERSFRLPIREEAHQQMQELRRQALAHNRGRDLDFARARATVEALRV